MEKSSASHALKLALLLALLVLVISEEKESLNDSPFTRKVRIYHDLKGNFPLKVHCTGPGKDTGELIIIRGQHMKLEFEDIHEDVPVTFKCRLKWNEKEHTIKAYSTARDKGRCILRCWWNIRDDCAYSLNEYKGQYEPLECW